MIRLAAALTLLCAAAVAPAYAQSGRIPSHCISLAQGPDVMVPATFGDPLEENTVRIRYLDHASYLIETRGGLTAVTDFTGFTGARDLVPDVVTMNNAHATHWTANPDPRIPHVLEGWSLSDPGGARHELDLGEMLVRNVATDTRSRFEDGVNENGNSIFIFEVAGLCIGHLGHLHQELSDEQHAAIGRLDVVMVPVDGGYTMSTEAMARVVKRFRSSVVLPMHWFSGASLEVFLGDMAGEFAVVRLDQPDLEMSYDRLPAEPTIIVLQPEWLN
jgi:L-ascorbate metabolism protein UlaG (beta-lactamase superfamily)